MKSQIRKPESGLLLPGGILLLLLLALSAGCTTANAPESGGRKEPSLPPAGMLLPESVVKTVGGRTIHLLDFDPGPGRRRATVLFIHGFAGYGAECLSLGPLMRARGVRLIAPDLPGCGISPSFPGRTDMAAHEAFMGDLVKWVSLQAGGPGSSGAAGPLVVAAHSTGCQMALLSCLEARKKREKSSWDKVQGLFLLAPNGMEGEEGAALGMRQRWISDLAGALYLPEFYKMGMDMGSYHDPSRVNQAILYWGGRALGLPGALDRIGDYLEGVLGQDPLDGRLGGVALPVRILWGTDDRVLVPSWHRAFLAELPRAEFRWVPDCGHGIHHEVPDLVAEELDAFLSSLSDW